MADVDTTTYQPPAPDPELKRLEFLVGKWNLEGSFKESQFGPAGLVKGWHSWEWMTGGYFLVHRWEQELGTGVEYIGYDAPNSRFFTHYFDNNGPYDEAGSVYEGNFRGESYVQCGPARITYTPSADGKTIAFTSELSKTLQSQGFNAPDDDWVDWLEATFTKA